MPHTDLQHNRVVLAETMRLLRLSMIPDAETSPLGSDIALLDVISTARDQFVLWPICQGLLKVSTGRPEASAVTQVVNGVLGTIDAQADRTCEQLSELTAALADEGISPLFLKGAAFILENGLAPQPWRPMCDLDFLVGRDELCRTVEIARHLGYAASHDRFSEVHDVHYPMLLRPPDVIGLEAHVKLTWANLPASLSADAFQRDALSVDTGSGVVRIPSDLHRIAHLVIHAQISAHRFGRNEIALRDLMDWYHLAGRETVDLDELDRLFDAAGYQPHFRSFAAFCENFWHPGEERLNWFAGDSQAAWRETTMQALVDPRRRGRALLRNWARMAGRALFSPREAARLARSLAESRRPRQVHDLFRSLFR